MTARGAAPEIPAPVGFSSLLTTSWWIFRGHFGTLFKLMLSVVALDWLVRLISLAIADSDSQSLAVTFVALLPLVLRVTLGGLAMAVASTFIADSLAGESASLRRALRSCRPLMKELVAAAMFGALLGMLFVFGLQGIGLLLQTLFYGPPLIAQVIALEAKSFQAATPRVREMGRGQLGRLLGYLLAVTLGTGLILVLLPLIIASSSEALGEAGQLGVYVLVSVTLGAAALAFFSAVSTVAYFDLRARFEDYGPKELKAERGS
jgi:hypothetical protein